MLEYKCQPLPNIIRKMKVQNVGRPPPPVTQCYMVGKAEGTIRVNVR